MRLFDPGVFPSPFEARVSAAYVSKNEKSGDVGLGVFNLPVSHGGACVALDGYWIAMSEDDWVGRGKTL